MDNLSIRLRGVLIALTALAMSASLAFAAQAPAPASGGLENAATHAGKLAPVAGGDVATSGDENVDEAEEAEEAGESGDEAEEADDHCLTDPTTLTEDELAAMNHGSIVCWAAHQETWPEEFKNHGAWVSSWAHIGKGNSASSPAKEHGKGHDKTKEHGKGKALQQD